MAARTTLTRKESENRETLNFLASQMPCEMKEYLKEDKAA